MTASLRRTLAWAVMAALATYLLFFGGAWLGLYLTDLRIVTMAAAAGLLIAWGLVARTNPAWRPRSALLPAILAALASLAISTVFSRYPRISLEYLGYAVVLAALYLLLVRLLADPFFRQRIVTLASTLFIAVVGSYVFFIARHWVDWWSAAGVIDVPPLRPEYESLTYGTPSTVLTVAAMLAVPTIANVVRVGKRGLFAAAVVVLLVGVIALLTGSRAGWVALAVAAAAAVALIAVDREARSAVSAIFTARVRRIAAVVAVLGLVLGALLGPSILHRATDGGQDTRVTYTRIALELFTESPVVGTGPGSWVIERLPHTRPDETDEYIPHAHDLYAQTLGELGLVGGAAGLFLVGCLILLCGRAIRSTDQTRRTWGWLTFVALVYFGAHQVFDFYPNMPAVLFTAAIPVAFLDALALEHGSTVRSFRLPTTVRRAAEVGGALLVSLAIGGLLLQEVPARAHDEAVDLANNGDWQAALEPASSAAKEDPAISPYVFTAGLAAAWSGDQSQALDDFQIVAQRDDFPEAWLNLAAEQAELALNDDALASLRSALRLGRQRPVIAMPAGDLALRLGDPDLAIEAFASALSVTPSLAADPWWTIDPARTALWPAIVQRADALTPLPVRWELALMRGDVDAATTLASATANADYTLEVIGAWTGNAQALEELRVRCDKTPNAIQELLWCARLADRSGDKQTGSRYRFVANVQAAGSYRQAHEIRVDLDPPTAYPILEGGASIAWGTYTYRRVTAWDVLAPGLIRLGFE